MNQHVPASRITPLTPPETDITPEILVERAAALQPLLRAQQAENDRRGCYSPELHQAFKDAGFYRIMQPKVFGGYQLPPSAFLKVVMEISRGHPGAGWCFALAGSHAYFVASHYPLEVQAELFGGDGEFRAGQVVFPGPSSMTPVDGGYEVSGIWPFASGSPVCTHFIGGAFLMKPDGPPEHVFFTVPIGQVEIVPDWGGDRFMGMQASGSHTVKLDKVFVPERFVIPATMNLATTAFPEGSRGYLAHGEALYHTALVGWFHCEFGAIMSGAAMAAIDDFAEMARTKAVLGDPKKMRREDPFIQNAFGRALGLAQSARTLTLAAVDLYSEQCRHSAHSGEPITVEQTLTVWGLAREACKMGCEAVDILFHNAGATVGRHDQKLQRYFRDIEMYRVHIQSQPMVPTMRGQLELGAPGKLPL